MLFLALRSGIAVRETERFNALDDRSMMDFKAGKWPVILPSVMKRGTGNLFFHRDRPEGKGVS